MEQNLLQSPLIREKEASICPRCGEIVSIKKELNGGFLYVTRDCPNCNLKKELVCKKDDITDNYFWNSPTSNLIREENYLNNIRVFDVLVTRKCNSNCNVCFEKWCGDKYEEMSISNLEELSKSVKNSKIVLNGGEPTVREDLVEMIEIIKNSGNIPLLYTNGLKLSNRSYLKKLKESGLNEVSISFDGFDGNIYETIRGGKEQYSETVKALDNLEKEKIKVSLYSTIVKNLNEKQIHNIIDFANSHSFVWTVSFKPLYLPGVNPSAGFDKNHVMSYSEILNLISQDIDGLNYEYICLTQSIFSSLQEIFAEKKNPVYLSWVDLPCIYVKRGDSGPQLLFSHETLRKINSILNTESARSSIKLISKIMPFGLDSLESLIQERKVFRILLGGIMPQISLYKPPIAMVCQKNNELSLYSYLAW